MKQTVKKAVAIVVGAVTALGGIAEKNLNKSVRNNQIMLYNFKM